MNIIYSGKTILAKENTRIKVLGNAAKRKGRYREGASIKIKINVELVIR